MADRTPAHQDLVRAGRGGALLHADASSRQRRGVNHAALVRLVTDYLDCLPHCWYAKIVGGPLQRPGLPDIIAAIGPVGMPAAEDGMHAAEFVAIELKTGSAVLNAAQQRERERIERAGGLYILAHRVDDVEAALVGAGLARPCLL